MTTTLMGLGGFPAGHRLDLGMPGYARHGLRQPVDFQLRLCSSSPVAAWTTASPAMCNSSRPRPKSSTSTSTASEMDKKPALRRLRGGRRGPGAHADAGRGPAMGAKARHRGLAQADRRLEGQIPHGPIPRTRASSRPSGPIQRKRPSNSRPMTSSSPAWASTR